MHFVLILILAVLFYGSGFYAGFNNAKTGCSELQVLLGCERNN